MTSHIKLKNNDQAVVVGYFHNLHCIVSHERSKSNRKLFLNVIPFSGTCIKDFIQRPISETTVLDMRDLATHVSRFLQTLLRIISTQALTIVDHCLEVLRRSILCKPDLTLHAIHWQTEEKLGMTLQPESTRECVDFSALYDFAMTRKFPRNMIVGVEDSVYDS